MRSPRTSRRAANLAGLREGCQCCSGGRSHRCEGWRGAVAGRGSGSLARASPHRASLPPTALKCARRDPRSLGLTRHRPDHLAALHGVPPSPLSTSARRNSHVQRGAAYGWPMESGCRGGRGCEGQGNAVAGSCETERRSPAARFTARWAERGEPRGGSRQRAGPVPGDRISLPFTPVRSLAPTALTGLSQTR